MACAYSIQINGQKYKLFEGVEEGKIKDIDDLKEYLRSVDVTQLKKIKDAMVSSDQLSTINLKDINENSVGLFDPTDLINTIADNTTDARAWKSLDVGDKKAKIVISGFGDESDKTGFKGDHIFLNMNYLYDKDNSIIALTELALHKKYGNNFKDKAQIIENNPNSDESRGIIKSLIDTQYGNVVSKLSGAIVSAYERAKIKLHQDIGESNLAITHDNLNVTWDKFGQLAQPSTIDSNYLPKSSVLVQNLKPGDIVLIPIENVGRALGHRTVPEMFYDSYVDVKGKTIIRTLVKHTIEDPQNPGKLIEALQTRKRVASKFDSKDHLVESNSVDARIQNSDIHDLFEYDDTTDYESISTKVKNGYMSYQSTLDLLKSNPKAKVVIDKVSHQIKQIQGQSITLDDGNVILVSDVNKVDYPLDPSSNEGQFQKLNEEDVKNNPNWTKFNHASIGEHIAFKKGVDDPDLTEGVVVAVGRRGDNKVLYYRTAPKVAEGKSSKTSIGFIAEANVRYISSPTAEYHLTTEEQSQVNDFVGSNFLDEQGHVQDLALTFAAHKPNSFKELDYSVSQVNKYSKISPKDILYDTTSKSMYKVVHSGLDFIKATRLVDNDIRYWTLQKEDLSSFLLFSKSPINESFANSHIRKNSANLYAEQRDGSVEATIWRNYNGYTYALPKRLTMHQFETHPLFERRVNPETGKVEMPVDVTNEKIQELAERYKWDKLPNTLYMKFGENGKSIYKDTENTLRIPIDNENFKKVFDNLESLQTYLVPGSFIQFKGNADSFIVEKAFKDHIELATYHHTFSPNLSIKDPKLQYVKAEKFFLDKEALADNKLQVANLYLPKWATAAYDNLSQYKTIENHKDSRLTKYSVSDSNEIVGMLADVVKSKYNTEVNFVHTYDVAKMGNPDLLKAAAFATKDGIFINMDKASIEEPVHEVLHLILATMKASDAETYYKLVNSVQYHPLFKEISKSYDEINTERLEETFVKLLSQTFRKNILKEGVYNEPAFNRAMKQSISDLMDLSEDLTWEDSFDILGKSINDTLFDFGSKLVDNEESLIDRKSVSYMFDISGKIKKLLDDGKLEQKCNY